MFVKGISFPIKTVGQFCEQDKWETTEGYDISTHLYIHSPSTVSPETLENFRNIASQRNISYTME
jgi:hypothetical protein